MERQRARRLEKQIGQQYDDRSTFSSQAGASPSPGNWSQGEQSHLLGRGVQRTRQKQNSMYPVHETNSLLLHVESDHPINQILSPQSMGSEVMSV